MGKDIKNILLHKKVVDFIISILSSDKDIPTRDINKNLMIEAYLYKLVRTLEEEGIIKRKKVGRSKYIKLTEKGKRIAEHLKKIYEVLETI